MTNTTSVSLQSKDHGQLLDVIDLLRSQGISHYVPLPQLIVCGDQSSGKSSVLEAVSGVRFPTKDNLCTRFATELILRRGPTASPKLVIIPGGERSDEEKEKLLNFKVPTVSIDEFPSLIDKAKEAMGLNSDTKAFSDDVLRVEISGPNQPHLTLVDLPGLIHAENKQQSAKDLQLVSSLVRSYMANSRSIILAVVSARNDYANQIVTKLARDVDPKGLRTLGIITKPDSLHVGSESEKAFLNLAKNEDVIFRLGWHVLRNRDFTEREYSVEERDNAETDLFSQGIWTSLSTSSLGIGTLKPRLSTVLRDQIVSEMPNLIHDVEAGIEECRSRLARLGEARGTPQEQRLYLIHISQSFSSLVKAAVGGVYVHDFFGDATTKAGYSKRLRAIVQNSLVDFAEDMRREGHDQEITEDAPEQDDESIPRRISRSDFIEDVRELMRRSRGCELVGTFNPLIVGDLFYRQSRPWKRLVERYCESILQAARLCLELILIHTTDETTRDGLLREIIEPAMDRITKELGMKVSEIMRPHQKGHPITYNHYFTETIQKARQEHEKKNMIQPLNAFFKLKPQTTSSYIQPQTFITADLLDALTQRTEEDPDRFACSEAVDCMEAYYKVSAIDICRPNFTIVYGGGNDLYVK
jgi:GTPase SAR1 family protein